MNQPPTSKRSDTQKKKSSLFLSYINYYPKDNQTDFVKGMKKEKYFVDDIKDAYHTIDFEEINLDCLEILKNPSSLNNKRFREEQKLDPKEQEKKEQERKEERKRDCLDENLRYYSRNSLQLFRKEPEEEVKKNFFDYYLKYPSQKQEQKKQEHNEQEKKEREKMEQKKKEQEKKEQEKKELEKKEEELFDSYRYYSLKRKTRLRTKTVDGIFTDTLDYFEETLYPSSLDSKNYLPSETDTPDESSDDDEDDDMTDDLIYTGRFLHVDESDFYERMRNPSLLEIALYGGKKPGSKETSPETSQNIELSTDDSKQTLQEIAMMYGAEAGFLKETSPGTNQNIDIPTDECREKSFLDMPDDSNRYRAGCSKQTSPGTSHQTTCKNIEVPTFEGWNLTFDDLVMMEIGDDGNSDKAGCSNETSVLEVLQNFDFATYLGCAVQQTEISEDYLMVDEDNADSSNKEKKP